MSKKVTVEASELWDYFQRHKTELMSSMFEIASNDEFGVVVYITEERGSVRIVVVVDDDVVFGKMVTNEKDCVETIKRVYDEYLTGNVVGVLMGEDDDDEDDRLDIEDQIEEREIELEDALRMFLGVVCNDEDAGYDFEGDLIDDIKEHFLEYLARKCGIMVYRPMFLEDEYGEEFFEEYPYECMIFDDENSPVYK